MRKGLGSIPCVSMGCAQPTRLISARRRRAEEEEASRGFEPRSLDSESRVLTVTPRGRLNLSPPGPLAAPCKHERDAGATAYACTAKSTPRRGPLAPDRTDTIAHKARPDPNTRSQQTLASAERHCRATGCKRPVGLMDEASAPGAGDSRFESWAGHARERVNAAGSRHRGTQLAPKRCPHQGSNLGCRGHDATPKPLDDVDPGGLTGAAAMPTRHCIETRVAPPRCAAAKIAAAVNRAVPGIEIGTSRTRTENHATRQDSRVRGL